jgi:catechol 2,3-dioxygenase-like lactoylglutathione lyase family enzyme
VPQLRLSHLGLCVSNLERSLHFYREALGFKEDSSRPRLTMQGGPAAALLEVPDVALEAVYLERDGTCLELLAFPHPGTHGEAAPRPMNRLGLTHLSFEVDDLDAVARRVLDAGGRIHEPSRIPVALFVLDPDGTRIELVLRPPARRDVPA